MNRALTANERAAFPTKSAAVLRFCMPAFLIWILLLPVAPLLVLALLIVSAANGINPMRAAAELLQLIAALRGTFVEVQTREAFIVVGLL